MFWESMDANAQVEPPAIDREPTPAMEFEENEALKFSATGRLEPKQCKALRPDTRKSYRVSYRVAVNIEVYLFNFFNNVLTCLVGMQYIEYCIRYIVIIHSYC